MSEMLSSQFQVFEEQMLFRVARQSVLAANLANADTPGYRRGELTFSTAFESEVARLRQTNPSHLSSIEVSGDGKYRVERGPRGTRPDGNGVDMDTELVAASRNAGAFMDQASVLGRLVALYRAAIGGGR